MESITAFINLWNKTPTSLVIAFSAIAAMYGLYQTRHLAKQKNTLDFDNAHSANEELLEAYVTLRKITELENGEFSWESTQRLIRLATTHKDEPEAAAIRLVLNTWERAARGIKMGVYDEEILFQAFKSLIRKIDNKTEPYRKAVRNDSSSYYEHFEDMAKRWRHKR